MDRVIGVFVLLAAVVAAQVAWSADGADAGVVNQLAGNVTYAGTGGSIRRAQAFMGVRQGDRFTLTAGSMLRIVYFGNGRQETWRGPAVLRAGTDMSARINGNPPELATLPMAVRTGIVRIPELVQGARLGGIVVRGGGVGRPSGPLPAEIEQARTLYKTLRGQASNDDVTPELFLLSVYHKHGYAQPLGPIAEEMLRRQPDCAEVRELAQWAQARANAPR